MIMYGKHRVTTMQWYRLSSLGRTKKLHSHGYPLCTEESRIWDFLTTVK